MQAALQTRPIILASSPNQTQKLKNQMTQTQPIHSIMTHGVQLKFYLLFSFYLAKSTRLYLQYRTTYLYPLCCRYTDTVVFFASLAQQANLWLTYLVECLTPPQRKFEKHTSFAVCFCFMVKKKVKLSLQQAVEVHKMLRIPRCLENWLTDGCKVVRLTCQVRFTSRNIFWYSFLLEAE
jgi:hypothetical protein